MYSKNFELDLEKSVSPNIGFSCQDNLHAFNSRNSPCDKVFSYSFFITQLVESMVF